MRLNVTFAFLALLSTAFPSFADDTPSQFEQAGLHYDEAKAFYAKLQQAVSNGDKKTVAGLIHYPFATKINGKVVDIKNQAGFIKEYEQIFTTKITDSLKNTSFDSLGLHDVGAMTAGGLLWIGGTRTPPNRNGKYEIRVIAINN